MVKRVGGFQPGVPRAAGAGRRKGTPNKMTAFLKADILNAGIAVGHPKWHSEQKRWIPGATSGNVQSYLEWLALTHPNAYAALLGRVIPLQIVGEGGGPVRIIDETMSAAAAAHAYAEALKASPPPVMIDVTPMSAPLPRTNGRTEAKEPTSRKLS